MARRPGRLAPPARPQVRPAGARLRDPRQPGHGGRPARRGAGAGVGLPRLRRPAPARGAGDRPRGSDAVLAIPRPLDRRGPGDDRAVLRRGALPPNPLGPRLPSAASRGGIGGPGRGGRARGRWGSAAAMVLLLAAPAGALAWRPMADPTPDRWGHAEIELALAYLAEGRLESAIDALDDARALDEGPAGRVAELLAGGPVRDRLVALARDRAGIVRATDLDRARVAPAVARDARGVAAADRGERSWRGPTTRGAPRVGGVVAGRSGRPGRPGVPRCRRGAADPRRPGAGGRPFGGRPPGAARIRPAPAGWRIARRRRAIGRSGEAGRGRSSPPACPGVAGRERIDGGPVRS